MKEYASTKSRTAKGVVIRTNDVFRSSVHRVLNASAAPRWSAIFFNNMDEAEPSPTCPSHSASQLVRDEEYLRIGEQPPKEYTYSSLEG